MKKTTLVIMAAGIGSRFGKGKKQLTPVGPSGELIIDYSIHDALRAGFDKIVFIIRKDILDEFKETIGDRIAKKADVEYVFQEMDNLPAGYENPADRKKPWGTGQAVLCCKGVVTTPFAVINADDYYGVDTFKVIHDYIVEDHKTDHGALDICMAGFRLGNTLSEHGGVTRGVCAVDENGLLIEIDETKNIEKKGGDGVVRDGGSERIIPGDTPVSMNMWGFPSEFIPLLENGFEEFLKSIPAGDTSSEFLLPMYVGELLDSGKAVVKVIDTPAKWFGVTYQEDKALVQASIQKLVDDGVYEANIL